MKRLSIIDFTKNELHESKLLNSFLIAISYDYNTYLGWGVFLFCCFVWAMYSFYRYDQSFHHYRVVCRRSTLAQMDTLTAYLVDDVNVYVTVLLAGSDRVNSSLYHVHFINFITPVSKSQVSLFRSFINRLFIIAKLIIRLRREPW